MSIHVVSKVANDDIKIFTISALSVKKLPSYDGIYKKQHVSANKESANNPGQI